MMLLSIWNVHIVIRERYFVGSVIYIHPGLFQNLYD